MKKLEIFEPAMCCSTGLCGVGVDPELLRISTVLDTLKKKNIDVSRYNLSSTPQAFVTNKSVNQFIKENGVDGLPVAVLDGEIVIKGRYPSNDEFINFLNLSNDTLSEQKAETDHGCCTGSSCC